VIAALKACLAAMQDEGHVSEALSTEGHDASASYDPSEPTAVFDDCSRNGSATAWPTSEDSHLSAEEDPQRDASVTEPEASGDSESTIKSRMSHTVAMGSKTVSKAEKTVKAAEKTVRTE